MNGIPNCYKHKNQNNSNVFSNPNKACHRQLQPSSLPCMQKCVCGGGGSLQRLCNRYLDLVDGNPIIKIPRTSLQGQPIFMLQLHLNYISAHGLLLAMFVITFQISNSRGVLLLQLYFLINLSVLSNVNSDIIVGIYMELYYPPTL